MPPKISSELPDDPRPPRPLFRPAATTVLRVFVVGTALLVGTVAYGVFEYYHSPYWNGKDLAPNQPVLFSHRHHAGELRIDCRFCHTTVETAAFAGMPTTQTCLTCHSQLFQDTAMLRPVTTSASTGQPLRWTRVTRLPDHVYFDHSIHTAKGVGCVTCHGDLRTMALTAKAEPLDMRQCVNCHRDPGPHLATGASVPAHPAHLTNCSTCHH